MQPDSSRLKREIQLEYPEIGFYDASDPSIFLPFISTNMCVFSCFAGWLRGQTLHLTKKNFGCTTCGRILAGYQGIPRERLLEFQRKAGLKSAIEINSAMVGSRSVYQNEHEHIFIGPLKERAYEYLKTVTLFVNSDQLSALMTIAYYDCPQGDPPPVIAPQGTACSHFVPSFKDLTVAQAVIGATDVEMQKHIPEKVLSFTMTKPMYERLCGFKKGGFALEDIFQKSWNYIKSLK